MLYLTKSQENTLVLNINNNSRDTFTGYTLVFTHIMSKQEKTYVIDKSNPNVYFENIRYCTITLDLSTDDLIYEGQYQLNIYGESGDKLVFIGMAILVGSTENPFVQYISPNETNKNYIYVKD
jgi:hypothetical protein